MGRRPRQQSAAQLFQQYNRDMPESGVTAGRDWQGNDTHARPDPDCLCCKATHVLVACNTASLVVSIVMIAVGSIINNEVAEWDLRSVNIVGNLCVGIGVSLMITSLLGIMAARTRMRVMEFLYFLCVLLLVAFVALALVYVAVDTQSSRGYLRENWEDVQRASGTEQSYEEAADLVRDYSMGILAVLAVGLAVLGVTVGAAIRLMGLRTIAYSSLVSLGSIGFCAVVLAIMSQSGLPSATTWLLFLCGVVQMVAAGCGLAGFRNKNRECIRWLFIILLIETAVLVYVSVATFDWLLTGSPKKPENLLLVISISVTCAVVNATTIVRQRPPRTRPAGRAAPPPVPVRWGAEPTRRRPQVFVFFFYFFKRSAFASKGRSQLPVVHFSDNHRRFGGGKRRGKKWEYRPGSAL